MLEQIEFVVDKRAIELSHAVRMPEEIRPGVGEIVTRTIGDVVRDLNLLHLIAIDGMGTEIARDRRHGS